MQIISINRRNGTKKRLFAYCNGSCELEPVPKAVIRKSFKLSSTRALEYHDMGQEAMTFSFYEILIPSDDDFRKLRRYFKTARIPEDDRYDLCTRTQESENDQMATNRQ